VSDIAVTWAKAQTCMSVLKGRKGPDGVKGPDRLRVDRNAGQTLVHLASYADAAGEAWALVGVLAMEMDTSERNVQRGLEALKAAGLITPTGEPKKHNGRLIPIYQLALDHGPANTRERMRIARAAASPGDTGVTPSEDAGRHRRHPTGDTGVGARGDTGVTQIGKGISQEESHRARASVSDAARADVDAAVTAWSGKAPERVSPDRVERAWAAAVTRTGFASGQLLTAVRAAVARDPDFGRGKAMNLDRWLDEGRFASWLKAAAPDATAGSARKIWAGPEAVRDAVADAMGAGAVVSYLDPATWDGEAKAILTAGRTAADRLRQDAGRALKALGIKVEFVGSAARG